MRLKHLKSAIQNQFLDIVIDFTDPSPDKLRLILKDKSFIDIRISQDIKGRFDFHWERRQINGTIYRYDNFPDTKFKKLKTFPCHFHIKKENKVAESPFSKTLPEALIDFMQFVRKEMQSE